MKNFKNTIIPIILCAILVFMTAICFNGCKKKTEGETTSTTAEPITTLVEEVTSSTTVVPTTVQTTATTTRKIYPETTTEKLTTEAPTTMSTTTEEETTTRKYVPSPQRKDKKLEGTFRITCYGPHSDGGAYGYATATGETSRHLQTCAVDPNVIPLGSYIEVNGLVLKAVDVGGGVKGNHIDIFFDGSDAEAAKWLDSFGEYQDDVRIIG